MSTPLLSLVVLRSRDAECAVRFYESLGLVFDVHRHGNGPEHYACQLGSTVLEIYRQIAGEEGTSSTRIGIRVASVDTAVDRLRGLGARVLSAASDSPWGRRAVVQDPDGHKVELVEDAPSPGEAHRT
jgi:catechol 2,3-dioxygenase-like lactoylglutathione lyase family enzyme